MEFLVQRGMPLRLAHEATGKLVRLGEERRCRLDQLPREAFESIDPGLGTEVYRVLGVANALAAFRSAGSTAPAEVAKQLEHWRVRLGKRPS
jgi:argininosuccinate lyase